MTGVVLVGPSLDPAGVSVERNLISGNGTAQNEELGDRLGMVVLSLAPTIKKNRIFGNAGYGVYVGEKASPLIEENEISLVPLSVELE